MSDSPLHAIRWLIRRYIAHGPVQKKMSLGNERKTASFLLGTWGCLKAWFRKARR